MQASRPSFGLVLATVALWTSTILASMGAVGTSGCAKPPASVNGQSTATLTAPGIKALQAKEGIKYLDLIRDAAQDAEAAKVIPLATADKVVRWHRALAISIDQTPQGWQAVALKGLDQLQGLLTPSEQAVFGPYIASARLVYQAVVS